MDSENNSTGADSGQTSVKQVDVTETSPEQKLLPAQDIGGASAKVQRSGSNLAVNTKQDECSDNTDDGDNSSDISAFSDLSAESWQPVQGPISWVQEQMRQGKSPRKILEDLVPAGTIIPEGLDPLMLWKIIINIVSEPPKRKKLQHINTLEDVLGLLNKCKKIIVLTGAGVSVSCGIPDFRSRDGVYSRLAKDFPNLPDPQAMFDIHFFRNDPRPFFKFAKEIYPGQFKPSLCHHFIKLLEEKGKLLRNYTQNIDTLEQVAGIKNVVNCHGSFAHATCTICGLKVNSDVIKQDIFNQVIPHCPKCYPGNENAVMKPDIVFFGESLPEQFHNQMTLDKDQCDLLIVIGSSLKVRPVALIPNSLPPHVPQILINRERLEYLQFDTELLGNCDDIVSDLCRRMGSEWDQLASPGPVLTEVSLSALPTPPLSPSQSKESSSSPAPLNSEQIVQHCDSTADALQGSGDVQSPQNDFNNIQTSNTSETNSFVKHGETEVKHKHIHVKEGETNKISLDSKCPSDSNSRKRPHSAISDSCDNISEQTSKPSVDRENPAPTSSCSSEEVSNIVDAGHRKEVVSEPSHIGSHHDHHHHHHHVHHSSSGTNDLQETGLNAPFHSTHQHHHHPHTSHLSPTTNEPRCTNKTTDDIQCSKSQSEDVSQSEQEVKKIRLSPDDKPDIDTTEEADIEVDSTEEEDIIKMCQSKQRISLATRLSDDQVLYLPPSRYIFKGAEVYSDDDSDDESESMSESSSPNNDSEENNTKDPDLADPAHCPENSNGNCEVNATSEKTSDCEMEVPSSELKTCEARSTEETETLDTSAN